jgi:hypothetical protein
MADDNQHDDDLIGLSQLMSDLLRDFEFPADPGAAAEARRRVQYGNVWKAAVAGDIAAVRRGRGIFVRRADRAQAARWIGLRPRAAALIAA